MGLAIWLVRRKPLDDSQDGAAICTASFAPSAVCSLESDCCAIDWVTMDVRDGRTARAMVNISRPGWQGCPRC